MTPLLFQTIFEQSLTPTAGNDFAIFSDVIQRVQPKRILETGFFRGGSAALLLHLSQAHVTSVDPMVDPLGAFHEGKIEHVAVLGEWFPGRFTFLRKSSSDVRPDLAGQSFDLFNIDGDHRESGIVNDFQLALDLDIPWLVVDDFHLDVSRIYWQRFADRYEIVKTYGRDDRHNGYPIPRALMRRIAS